MKEDWPKYPLQDVCEVFDDGDWILKKNQAKDGIRLIQTGNIGFGEYLDHEERARYISEETFDALQCTEVLPGDLLISRLPEPVGRSCLVPDLGTKMITGVDCTIVRTKEDLDPEFLKYFQMSPDYYDQVSNYITGTTRSRISRKNLGKVQVPIPPLTEQKRIVAILDDAFDAIDRAKANVERNIANAQELFWSFLANCRLFKSDDESITQALSNISEKIVDSEHKTAPTQETGYPSIRTTNIGSGHLVLDNVKRVSEEVYNEWTRRATPMPGDLILAREAPAGNVGVIPPNEKVCLGQRTVLIRPDKNVADSKFLAYLLLHPSTQKRLLSKSSGATVQHINMKDIRNLNVGELPTLEDQKEIVELLDEVQTRSINLETLFSKKLSSLEELRSSLLQKAFQGELSERVQEEIAA